MNTDKLGTPSLDLTAKRALVTGAGRGIGRACARGLAGAGAAVTLVSRTATEIEQAADEIRAAGACADVLVCDVADVAAITASLGPGEPWDILVNNAGTNDPQSFLDVDEATYDRITDLNVKGAFFVARAVAAKLVASGRPGSLINMSSQMGHVGGRRRSQLPTPCHSPPALTVRPWSEACVPYGRDWVQVT